MQTLAAGTTVHLLSASKYHGKYRLIEVAAPDANGWQHIKAAKFWSVKNHAGQVHSGTSVIEWHTRTDDAFATEADARSEAKARRQPRRQRMSGYGDFGQLGAFLGVNR